MQPSGSDPTAFDRLHPKIQRWIRAQGWSELRDIQDLAIGALIDKGGDVLISAATAAGKTEAAFLPILTRSALASETALTVLYVSPLKALINDQFRRLDLLCEQMEIPVVRWHGDAPQGPKQRLIKQPRGIALITPESIEALLVRRPGDARRLFAGLEVVVIDELHAFLQGPRSMHLASLLNRIDLLTGRRAQRVGLSATLGDPAIAARWLNASAPEAVRTLVSQDGGPELRLQVRGYAEPPGEDQRDDLETGEGAPQALDQIADHLFAVLRGSNNLVFGGSRRTVEALSDRLRRRSETRGLPNEFFPHHGSLSKDLREDLELRLKKGDAPTSAVATSTLELGVDIGSVASVAQIGAPRSLAALRQRLGRSGRREGAPAVLRIYVREKYLDADADPLDRIRSGTARAVAAVRLLLDRFVETPRIGDALATAVLHQTLSLLTERGALRPEVLFRMLCRAGPFDAFEPADYADLLRGMGATEPPLLEQSPDGAMMLGPLGERIVAGRDFYAIFESDQEWRIVHGGRTLGTIPLSNMVGVGSLLAFAGRRWRISAVDDLAKVLEVVSHPAGRLPKFDRLYGEPLHDRLAAEVREVYLASDIPAYLNETAARFLEEGRIAFAELGLGQRSLIASGNDCHLVTWRGSVTNSGLAVALMACGLECDAHDLGVTIADTTPAEALAILRHLHPMPSSEDLSGFVQNLRGAKYDEFIPEALLRRLWSRANAEVCRQLPAVVEDLVRGGAG